MKSTRRQQLTSLAAIMMLFASPLAKGAENKDIVDTAIAAGSFNTLATALQAADLVDALKADGPYTVFAPTDEAFAKLPAGTVESLLEPENKSKLAAILKYHVLSGRVYSEDALAAKKAKTLQGSTVEISVSGDQAKVNNAALVTVDLDASNGVIHVIDQVLLPPEKRKVSAAETRSMIEHAVARGARAYNAGHHAVCAELYMTTMRKMLKYGDQMPETIVSSMRHALTRAENTHCPTQRSWTLRRGLDHAYHQMARLQ